VGLDGAAGTLVDVGFALCLAALLVFLVIQFRRTGRRDD
jgi:uncharacterized protein (TIGR03382 family)